MHNRQLPTGPAWVRDPWDVWTLLVREPGDLPIRPVRRDRSGPRRDDEEPEPMMHNREKFDPL
jgi:hypothetical protein